MDLETQCVCYAVSEHAAYGAKPHECGTIQFEACMNSRMQSDPGLCCASQHGISRTHTGLCCSFEPRTQSESMIAPQVDVNSTRQMTVRRRPFADTCKSNITL